MDKNQFLKKTVIITGGGGIIGSEFSKKLALLGANVIIVEKEISIASKISKKIIKLKPDASVKALKCNLLSEIEIKDMIKKVLKFYGSIDAVVNNAATKTSNLKNFFKKFEDYKLSTWKEVMSVNIDSFFLVSKYAGQHMAKNKNGGSIINISSIYGIVAPDSKIYEGSKYNNMVINTPAVYSVSKAAVLGLTKYLAKYWGDKNIRVNSISPGGVESGQNKVFVNKYSEKVPLGRMAKATDMSNALIFLISDSSKYITGQNLVVDGGFTI